MKSMNKHRRSNYVNAGTSQDPSLECILSQFALISGFAQLCVLYSSQSLLNLVLVSYTLVMVLC